MINPTIVTTQSTAKKPSRGLPTGSRDRTGPNMEDKMFAVIKTGGKQFRVTANDRITVAKIEGNTGDTVAFHGVYEWNAQGGVIHWTHHDPVGRHVAGWLKHNGQTYQ